MKQAGQPRSRRATCTPGEHYGTENAAEVWTLEDLLHHRSHDRSDSVTQRALGEYHEANQPYARLILEDDQCNVADRKPEGGDRPNCFATNPIGQMTQKNLAGNAEETDHPKSPDADARTKTNIEQKFCLMHLHGVPN